MTFVPGTEPYAWPYDGQIDPVSLALVVAGWDTEWRERTANADLATEACAELAVALAAFGATVITVTHRGRPLEPPTPTAIALTALGLDGFWGGPLEALLRSTGRTHLLVAGHGLEGPVHSLLRGANDRGFECLLVIDAASAVDPELSSASASMVCMSGGIFGAVGTTDAVLTTIGGNSA